MQTSTGLHRSDGVKTPGKPRRLPEIPKDQTPYDVTRPPKKPPRLLANIKSESRKSKINPHKRSNSMADIKLTSADSADASQKDAKGKSTRSKSTSMTDLASAASKLHVKHYNGPPLYCNDAILSRRCGSCYQRVFPDQQSCLSAQSYLFHTSCFACAICGSALDVTNYCYFTEHEKFYCYQHYHEISKAEETLGNEKAGSSGVGPAAFSGAVYSYTYCYSQQRKRKQMVKTVIELQKRRALLEKTISQLERTREHAEREEKLLLWKKWFDMTYEKMIITKGVTELAYQIKENELREDQEQIQRKLRRLKKRRDEGTREENTEQEKECLQRVLDVIEKRDLLLLELEIERRRDDDEIEQLLSIRAQTENLGDTLHGKTRHYSYIPTSQELLDECVIL